MAPVKVLMPEESLNTPIPPSPFPRILKGSAMLIPPNTPTVAPFKTVVVPEAAPSAFACPTSIPPIRTVVVPV